MVVVRGRRLILVVCEFNDPKYEQECNMCVIHKIHDCPLLCVSPNTDFGRFLLNAIESLTYGANRTKGEFE